MGSRRLPGAPARHFSECSAIGYVPWRHNEVSILFIVYHTTSKQPLNAESQLVVATKKGVDRLNQHQDNQERLNIQNWLTPIDYTLQHSEAINRRQSGTGQWLLDSFDYQKWLQANNETLFCQGMPGAGKTILTSIVVDDLLTRFGDDGNIGVAYIYCNFRRTDEQKPEDIIANLLKQLAQGQSSLPGSVKSLHDDHKERRKQPSLDELFETLQLVIALYSKIFMVIDAIDECQTTDGKRSELLAKIFAIQASCSANIFATSRIVPETLKSLDGITFLEIRADRADVKKYLEQNVHQLTASLDWTDELRRHVITSILDAVDGVFLLARLYLLSLDDKTTRSKVMAALAQFKKKGLESNKSQNEVLNEAYDSVMERITTQTQCFQDLAKKVLSWITCAKRPLTTTELRHAIAVEANASCLEEDNFETVARMVSVCAGLISVQPDQIIELVHYTVQEYFERTKDTWFPNAQLEITTTCASYLSFDAFATGSCSTDEDFFGRLESNPLFDYAARHWGHHARDVFSRGQQVMPRFLDNEANASASAQAMMADKSGLRNRRCIPKSVSGLHLVAHFGLDELVLDLLRRGHDPNVRDANGRTPLSWAAQEGHDAVLRTLLAAEGDPNLEGKFIFKSRRRSMNTWSLENSYAAKLLYNGSGYEDCGATPIWYAARNGHESTCRLLLAAKSTNHKETRYGTTPLWCASGNGHKTVVDLLLERGWAPDEPEKKGGLTPLSIAAWRGHTAVVKLLLETAGVNPNHVDFDGETPLGRAAFQDHGAVCELLLNDGRVEPDSRSRRDFTPLLLASMMGHETIVALLLAKDGVDVNAVDSRDGYSPLQWAVQTGKGGVVRLLLADKRVDVNPATSATLLWTVVHNGYHTVLQQLLATNQVDLNSRYDGETLLHIAARRRHPEVMHILLATGAFNPNLKNQFGQTALSLAAMFGNEDLALLLLKTGKVNIYAWVNEGRTPLSAEVDRNHETIVKLPQMWPLGDV